ncbi:MAG: helix-turn-helix domain-containing protein [Trichodesmium sp. ALOHA_ZT_67]|nr:helix-turn-helix domain-containing protein [Trichodesmium erythraeum GBRTRLIN201]MCH2047426.1 helix-turn-helix domain-containing protein [Trichodesmium sp. ALOHA_ZT_67]MDE5093295.1 helix-turn-helix domain-containing protein [Trichodesmium sp. St11_bin5]MDT9339387.1 helix-turn-helix domain-containing protein [Trichodesmium erythraeum 21-75]
MLTLNYQDRLIPIIEETSAIDRWLDIYHFVYNYALRERKDWTNS